MALIHSLVVVWFHRHGQRRLRFPDRPWYPGKEELSFVDLLTTLRRVSYHDQSRTLVPKRGHLKTRLTGILSRAG